MIKSLQEKGKDLQQLGELHIHSSYHLSDASSAVVMNLLFMKRAPLCWHGLVVLPTKCMTMAGLSAVDAIRVCKKQIFQHFSGQQSGLTTFLLLPTTTISHLQVKPRSLWSLMVTGVDVRCSIQEQELSTMALLLVQ